MRKARFLNSELNQGKFLINSNLEICYIVHTLWNKVNHQNKSTKMINYFCCIALETVFKWVIMLSFNVYVNKWQIKFRTELNKRLHAHT